MNARICVGIPRFANHGDMVSFDLAAFLFTIERAVHVQAGLETWADGTVTLEPAPHPPDCVDGRADLFRSFLAAGDRYTHLWCVDADTAGPPDKLARAVRGMLTAGKDWIACPVVLKSYDWAAVADYVRKQAENVSSYGVLVDPDPQALEAASHRYSPDLHALDLSKAKDEVLQVDRTHLACTLLRRDALVRLVDAYRPDLEYWRPGPKIGPGHVALPLLSIAPSGELVREDYAVADRFRAIGGELFLYLGAGAMDHVGLHRFTGASAEYLPGRRPRLHV